MNSNPETQLKHHIEAIQGSVGRARNLLLAISLIAAWMIAMKVEVLLRWEPVRAAFTHNIVKSIDSTFALRPPDSISVRVPMSAMRPSDKLAYWEGKNTIVKRIRFIGDSIVVHGENLVKRGRGVGTRRSEKRKADTADTSSGHKPVDAIMLVRYPLDKSLEEQANWCAEYERYIAQQWSLQDQHRAALVIERGEITKSILPNSTHQVPSVALPLINITTGLDDVFTVGGIVVLAAFAWFYLSMRYLRTGVERFFELAEEVDSTDSGTGRTNSRTRWKSWVSLQFFFVDSKTPHPSGYAFPLLYLPAVALLLGLLDSMGYVLHATRSYNAVTGTGIWNSPFWSPGIGPLAQETYGIIIFRILLLSVLFTLLLILANKCWCILRSISKEINENQSAEEGIGPEDWNRITLLMLAPTVLYIGWAVGRNLALENRVNVLGWTYGIPLIGVIPVLIGGGIAFWLLKRLWHSLKNSNSGLK